MMAARPAGGPRVLLRRLREVMAEPQAAQTRLDRIVRLIASNMVAEVCSIYLKRGEGSLELYATEGLNPSSVHHTRLQVGEGLVGLIAQSAEPVALSDAQQHPKFAYRPETGEEIYHSLMGVPILRSGRVIGVVAVQNRTMRHYAEEEVEALQTVAMVLAELVATGELIDIGEITGDAIERELPVHLKGIAVTDGIAQGRVVLHQPRVAVTELIASDPELERLELDRALQKLRASIDEMLAAADFARGGEHREVLEAYRMFAHDEGWIARLNEAVDTGLTAAAAAERVQMDTRTRMMRVADPYLRERFHDLDDLSNRLLRILTGTSLTAAGGRLPDDAVILARNMGPAELLDYDREKLRGIVLEEGSPTSHVAIVARALELPLVGRATGTLDRAEPGDRVVVDGDSGDVYLRPSTDVEAAYGEKLALRAQRKAVYASIRNKPAITLDGQEIDLDINAGLLVDLPHLEETNAHGIGLFRTEIQFMVSATLPRLSAQTELYRSVLDAAKGRPVTFRTLDIGGDKVLPYLETAREENPALGWRAIRIALDRPALLRYQIRALLQAADGQPLRIMFPMIANVSEYIRAREIVDREVRRLEKMGRAIPNPLRVGTMLEVPSLAWQLDALLPLTDFVSVGSNDLLQFFYASDRGNPRLANRYDLLSPAMLNLLGDIVRRCREHGVPVSVCGEVAGRPLEAMSLIGLGLRNLSMPPAAVGPVRLMVRSLDAARLAQYLDRLLRLPDPSVRDQLQAFAQDHGIMV